MREFTDACRAEGLKAGLYLSPWDRHEPSYGDSLRYNNLYCDQLTELLTQYGAIQEVWFDGANGEGPNGKRQEYDWPRVWALVRRLQPNAVMFSDAGPDIRWIGNEVEWAGTTTGPQSIRRSLGTGNTGDDVMRSLQNGGRSGNRRATGETDVPLAWLVLPSGRRHARKERGRSCGVVLQSVGAIQAPAQCSSHARRPAARDRRCSLNPAMRARWIGSFTTIVPPVESLGARTTGARSAVAELELSRVVMIGMADRAKTSSRAGCGAIRCSKGLPVVHGAC